MGLLAEAERRTRRVVDTPHPMFRSSIAAELLGIPEDELEEMALDLSGVPEEELEEKLRIAEEAGRGIIFQDYPEDQRIRFTARGLTKLASVLVAKQRK